jgi:hypothetical protein
MSKPPASFHPLRLRNLFAELANFRRDRAQLSELRIYRFQILYFSYLSNAALGLPGREIREQRTFLLTPLFLYLLAIGDVLLERYGRLFSLPELERRLEVARQEEKIFWFGSDELVARGADRDQLHTLPRDRKFPVTDDPCQLILRAADAIHDIVHDQPIDAEMKRRARQEFALAYNTIVSSAIYERRLLEQFGPFPPPDETWKCLRLKSSDFAEHWLDCLLLASGQATGEYRQAKELLGAFGLYAAVLDDDVRDVAPDFGRQPNIVLSVARHRFPSEFTALEQALERGETFRTIRSRARLKVVLPNTLAFLDTARAETQRRLLAIPFFYWISAAQKMLIDAKVIRDSLASWLPAASR